MNRNNKTKKFTSPVFASGPTQMGPVASRLAASGATNLSASIAKSEASQRVMNRLRAAGATHLANSLTPTIFSPSANSAAVSSMFARGPPAAASAPAESSSPYTFLHSPQINSGYNSNNYTRIVSGYNKSVSKKGGKRSSRKTRRRHRK